MKTNIGNLDRSLRLVAGAAILGAGFYFKSWWGLVGLVPILTALIRFCPLYPVIGISTCKRE